MADWRRLAKALILADGTVEPREVVLLQKELLYDQKIDKSELDFLVELRKEAKSLSRAFEDFFFDVIKKTVIADRGVSGVEATWLRDWVLADGKVDDLEIRLLRELRKEAIHTSNEFEELYKECMKMAVQQEDAKSAPAKSAKPARAKDDDAPLRLADDDDAPLR